FGGIGYVIGHELTHGFDDQGRKFDPSGNLRDWWTVQDGQEFEKRAGCVANEYGNFVAVDDLKLNGKLTLGENTADNGGARISLTALRETIAADASGKAAEKIDGYTPEQRFFLGMGRVWCEKRGSPAGARKGRREIARHFSGGLAAKRPRSASGRELASGRRSAHQRLAKQRLFKIKLFLCLPAPPFSASASLSPSSCWPLPI